MAKFNPAKFNTENSRKAAERMQQIVAAWTLAVTSYPPEVAAAQVSLVVIRREDIDAMLTGISACLGVADFLDRKPEYGDERF